MTERLETDGRPLLWLPPGVEPEIYARLFESLPPVSSVEEATPVAAYAMVSAATWLIPGMTAKELPHYVKGVQATATMVAALGERQDTERYQVGAASFYYGLQTLLQSIGLALAPARGSAAQIEKGEE